MKSASHASLTVLMVLVATLATVTHAAKLVALRSVHGRSEDNSINPERKVGYRKRDWLKISQAPPTEVTTQMGDRLELECEVIGSPAPVVHWVKGNSQQDKDVYESSNNRIETVSAGGLSKSKSRLIVECVLPQHEGYYTCVAVSGTRVVRAPPSRVLIEGHQINNLTALLSACRGDVIYTVPRVTHWSPVTMQDMGSDVTLPCRVTGHPQPASYWLDGDNELVGETDPRFKVLPSGDLLILNLRWSDMGAYKCVASNQAGSDSVESFLYPLLKEDS